MYNKYRKNKEGIKMFNIEEELKKLPGKPGVYVMHDKDDNIIYVGKAVSLKNRVRSYFRKTNKTERIKKMVSLIHSCWQWSRSINFGMQLNQEK